jgi:hypothetical protein
MTTEMWLIVAVRVAGSLTVLRWPLAGAVIAILVDLSDLFIRNLVDLGGVKDYQSFDKWLDQVYMAAFLVVALRWEGVERVVAVVLYVFRLAGFAAFEASGERAVLLAFPNLFEAWFLLIAGMQTFRVTWERSQPLVLGAGGVLLALKLLQEYALHVGQWFEGFTAVEAVEAVWDWVTGPFW